MTAPVPPPGSKKDGRSLAALIRRKPAVAAAAVAAAAVAVLALAKRSRSGGQQPGAGSQDDGGTGYSDTTAGTATPYTYDGSGGDTGYSDQMATMQSQLQLLGGDVTRLDQLTARQRRTNAQQKRQITRLDSRLKPRKPSQKMTGANPPRRRK